MPPGQPVHRCDGRISVVCQCCGRRFKSPIFDGEHDNYCSDGCRRRAEWGVGR
ncbi:uncharacterized protein NP_5367B [Natronomonas pharaonis DSM 2160]|uniref:Uncharacterized protein n=1 Tax=Natronomonas pharaonis (strain ATCC 35678 / DSM 2160 / CIP 103997 / JCM 8858 / NBRC 14720 / NCIMB 2260 / Gabara) TaxID=348780 RepID=A0A1U7EZP3_NATPD|nr:uncharacterized protein NP_5367B [Natronomonas pharaonis DSM 2160]